MAKKTTTHNSILTDISDYIKRFIVLPHEYQYNVLAVWCIHTWAFDVAKTTPYLYVHSPEKQSGKSLLLDVLASIVRNPMQTIDATGPVIFRAIETLEPTLMFDEVDAVWHGAKNEGLRGILNGGYKIGGKVYRLDKSSVVTFNTFCPKLLAGIHNGYLPDTLVDRCIPITMRRKQVSQKIEPFLSFDKEEEIEELHELIDEWIDENYEALEGYRQHAVDGLSDRESEIAWPLLAIAHQFGMRDEIAEAIISMITEYHEMTDETDEMLEMIHDIGELFTSYGRGKLHTVEMLDGLGMSEREAVKLAKYLDNYDIHPKRVRVGNRVAKGYDLDQFETLFGMHNIEVDV